MSLPASQQANKGDVQLAVLGSTAEIDQMPWSQTEQPLPTQGGSRSTIEVDMQQGGERHTSSSSSRGRDYADHISISHEVSGSQESVDLGSEKRHLLSGRRLTSSEEEVDQQPEVEDQQPEVEDHQANLDMTHPDAAAWQDGGRPWYQQGTVVVCLAGSGLITVCVPRRACTSLCFSQAKRGWFGIVS